jgi:hypothetical protein
MIRPLAQCPYCQGCEVALSDSFDVVLNPDADPPQPCPHLIWVEGRYTQWGLSPLPGRKTKIARMVGSNEFAWQHPGLAARDETGALSAYLKELTGAGGGWEFAPPAAYVVRAILLDEKIKDATGREYPNWDVEGTAVFAAEPEAFLDSLPACAERQNAAWTDLPGSSPG